MTVRAKKVWDGAQLAPLAATVVYTVPSGKTFVWRTLQVRNIAAAPTGQVTIEFNFGGGQRQIARFVPTAGAPELVDQVRRYLPAGTTVRWTLTGAENWHGALYGAELDGVAP